MISRRTAWHAELKVVILYSKTFLTDLPGLVWSGSSLCRLDLVKIDLDLVWRFSLIKIRRFLHCTAFCNPSFTVVFTGALLPVLGPAKLLVLVLCRIASSSQPDIDLSLVVTKWDNCPPINIPSNSWPKHYAACIGINYNSFFLCLFTNGLNKPLNLSLMTF